MGIVGGRGRRLRSGGLRPGIVLLGMATAAVVVALVATAWVDEDAFITFRTIDNFVNGYGLRWNVDERVQTYTHPLWLLLLTPVYFVTREIPTTVSAVGVLCTASAAFLLLRRFRSQPWVLSGLVLAPCLLSPTLLYFGTSGFETPLSFLLLSVFGSVLLSSAPEGPRLRPLAFVAALAAVNRLDTIVLYVPALAWALLAERRRGGRVWCDVVVGFTPLLAWLAFSLLYYGFALPNTAPAKLSAALPRSWYLVASAANVVQLVAKDVVAVALLLGSIVVTTRLAVRTRSSGPRSAHEARLAALGGGAVAYCLYAVWVGTDYHVGRFFALPVWASMIVVADRVASETGAEIRRRWSVVAGLFALVGALSFGASRVVADGQLPMSYRFRSLAMATLGADLRWHLTPLAEDFVRRGRELAAEAGEWKGPGRFVVGSKAIGLAGLHASPAVVLVDQFGLGDPLLARLSAEPVSLIGHQLRVLPAGYLEARSTGDLSHMDPALADYYRRLRQITQGPLTSLERLRTILLFNLGRYDPLRDDYESRRRPASGDERARPGTRREGDERRAVR